MTTETYAFDRASSAKAAIAALPLVLAIYASGMELFGSGFSYWGAIGACIGVSVCLTAGSPSGRSTATGYNDLTDDPLLWRFMGTAYAALGTLLMCALCARDAEAQGDLLAAAALVGNGAASVVPLPFVYVLMATLRPAFVNVAPIHADPPDDTGRLAPWQAAMLESEDAERPKRATKGGAATR